MLNILYEIKIKPLTINQCNNSRKNKAQKLFLPQHDNSITLKHLTCRSGLWRGVLRQWRHLAEPRLDPQVVLLPILLVGRVALLVRGKGLLLQARRHGVGPVPGQMAGAAGRGEAVQVAAAALVGTLRGGEDRPLDGDVAALQGEKG